MKRRNLLLVIGIMAALLLLAGDRSLVLAQAECSELEQPFTIPDVLPLNDFDAWEIVWNAAIEPDLEEDFDEDGFSVVSDGTGAPESPTTVEAHHEFPSPVTITSVAADISFTSESGLIAFIFCLTSECVDGDVGIDYEITHSGTQEAPFNFSDDTEFPDVIEIQISMQCSGANESCAVDNIVVEGVIEACLFRPVHEAETVDEDSSGDLYVITTDAGVRVYAIDDGVIQTVLHNADGYYVRLLVNGTTPVIYSKLSATFAEVGDTIEGGCVLGYVSQAGPEAQVDTGQFAYQHDPDLGDWHDYEESLSTLPCGQEEANCINANPEMNTDEPGWLTRFNSGGSFNQGDDSLRSIVGAGMLYQPGLAVDFEATYFVTVVVALQPPATNGEIRVWFGGTETRIPLHTIGPEFVTRTTLGFSTAFDGLSEFRIYNANSNSPTVRITFACLHQGDAVIAPPQCYFEDGLINSDSFETEGGATFETGFLGQGGQYSLPPGGAIRSPVHIEATTDADSDFTLTISGTGPDGAAEATASIVDSDTDDELQAIGTYIFPLVLWGTIKREFTLEASTALDGDLYIENTGDEDLLIGSLCLSSNSGSWAGYDNPDAADHSILPVDCTECNFPDSLIDVVAWVNWLGCLFNYLIRCLLYGLVNNIWATASAILSGIGLFGLWLGRAISIIAVWAWGAAGRLLAALISSLIPIVNAVLAWLFAQPFFRTILDAISIIGIWITAVWSYIELVRDFISTVFNYGIAILSIIANTYVTFYTALNSPASYHIIPDCSDTGAPLYHLCLVFDIMIFFFDQVPMALVFMGLLAALIMLAQFGRVLDLIGTMADSL